MFNFKKKRALELIKGFRQRRDYVLNASNHGVMETHIGNSLFVDLCMISKYSGTVHYCNGAIFEVKSEDFGSREDMGRELMMLVYREFMRDIKYDKLY
jgi:hypothetical protein